MRWFAVGLLPLLLAGCGAKYKPQGPVLTGYERAMEFPVHRSHAKLQYYGREPLVAAPVLPVLAFGAAWDLDLVVMPKDGDLEMYEFARIAMPDQPLWLAVETERGSGDQTIVANLDDIQSFMPEVPLARKSTSLKATDNSNVELIDVSLSYENSRGEMVEANIQGDPPDKLNDKRNGRAFNHSQNSVLAAVDQSSSESLFKADVKVEGKGVKLKKIGGFVPFQYAMEQAQGGMVIGRFSLVPTEPVTGSGNVERVMTYTGPTAPPPAPVEAAAPKAAMAPEMRVQIAIAKRVRAIQDCYEARLADEAELAGRVQLDLTLEAGKVTAASLAELEGDDVLTDEAMGTCLTDLAAEWTFDDTISGTTSWPFTFSPGEAAADGEDEGTGAQMTMGEGTSELTSTEAADDGSGDAEGGVEGASATRPGGESLDGEDLIGDAMAEDDAAGAEGDDALMELDDGEDAEMGGGDADPVIGLSNFNTVHSMANGGSVELAWQTSRRGDTVTAVQTTDLRTLTYTYKVTSGAYLELVNVTVEQYGRGVPVTAITFSPPLPDLRRRFDGNRISNFVIDVNGQRNNAKGEVEVYWSDAAVKVKVVPSAPDWTTERLLLTSVSYNANGTADVTIERIGE